MGDEDNDGFDEKGAAKMMRQRRRVSCSYSPSYLRDMRHF